MTLEFKKTVWKYEIIWHMYRCPYILNFQNKPFKTNVRSSLHFWENIELLGGALRQNSFFPRRLLNRPVNLKPSIEWSAWERPRRRYSIIICCRESLLLMRLFIVRRKNVIWFPWSAVWDRVCSCIVQLSRIVTDVRDNFNLTSFSTIEHEWAILG